MDGLTSFGFIAMYSNLEASMLHLLMRLNVKPLIRQCLLYDTVTMYIKCTFIGASLISVYLVHTSFPYSFFSLHYLFKLNPYMVTVSVTQSN